MGSHEQEREGRGKRRAHEMFHRLAAGLLGYDTKYTILADAGGETTLD
jgi:hypothetical protein